MILKDTGSYFADVLDAVGSEFALAIKDDFLGVLIMGIENLDTSYWKVKDKAWMRERELQWSDIESVMAINLNKREVDSIKQYFLKGKLPNWDKYKAWSDIFRPMDLRNFLLFHPSGDYVVLKSLYIDFVSSDCVHREDITKGYAAFIDNEMIRAVAPYESLSVYPFVYMGEKSRVLFNVLFDDLNFLARRLDSLFEDQEREDYVDPIFKGFDIGYTHFLGMLKWLLPKYNTPMIDNCIYQYPEVVDWCIATLTKKSDLYFLESIEHQVNVEGYQKALYCFYHHDVREENDRARFQFLQKIRQVLDEGDFVTEFKEMWNGVKSGKIVCDGAF